ncbi:MAG: P-loop NTPase [Parvularculaceae bacterium]|nr:P-loop NTPase [Parvularculaceae bacterium]
MVLSRLKDAARRGRAEASLRKALSERGLEGAVNLRSLDDRLSASVLLNAGSGSVDVESLEADLTTASGLDRVVVVTSDHGQPTAPPPPPAPTPKPAGGGHADPLRLGSRPTERQGPQRPEGVKHVIAVASGKGGVGKSTVAASLALELLRAGKKVGLLDLDIHGPSLPVLFPTSERLRAEDGKIIPTEQAGLKLVSLGYMVDERTAVAWRGPMVMNAARQLIDDTAWGELDVLIVDTPPGTGDAHLSMIQRLKLDGAVLVATPSPLATADVRRGAALFQKVGTPLLGVVLNMTGGPFGDELDEALLNELELQIVARQALTVEAATLPFGPDSGLRLPDLVTKILADLTADNG